ncbi:hypothetical protein ACP8HI_04580 [Paenibacillus sp. FA6]|uniref:hypothetical protein n=1 Tax=Paenibacillus sp. FA6 TaxID=3413029 RepID=UPI003F65A7A4
MFGIQISVIIIAVFTAFIGYQFRIREKRKDSSYSELSKSYNEVYGPMFFRLKEINQSTDDNEKQGLIDAFFKDFSSKAQLLGSSVLLKKYIDLNALFNTHKNKSSLESIITEKLIDFHTLLETEFWDAHDIIYKEHFRHKDQNFKPVKALYIEFIGTIKKLSTLVMSFCCVVLYIILLDYSLKLNLLSIQVTFYTLVATVGFIFPLYLSSLAYSYMFYKKTANDSRQREDDLIISTWKLLKLKFVLKKNSNTNNK